MKDIVQHALKFCMKSGLLIAVVIAINIQFVEISRVMIPAIKPEVGKIEDPIKKDLVKLGAPTKHVDELTASIRMASEKTNINPKVISALIYTESGFDKNAVGPKNRTGIRYKGLMQTAGASFEYSDVDILWGSRVLQEKLKASKGNLHMALALYKGGNNPTARKQANEVLAVYKRLL